MGRQDIGMMYVLKGTPSSSLKTSFAGRKTLDDYNMMRFGHQQQLRYQHGEEPFLTGLWRMEAKFYFDDSYLKSRGYVPHKPAISMLLRYLTDIMQGVIIENEYVIDEVAAYKYYGAGTAETVVKFFRSVKDK